MKILTKILMSLVVLFAIMGCFYAVNDKEFNINQIVTDISTLSFENPITSFEKQYTSLNDFINDKPLEDLNGLEKIVSYIGAFFTYIGNIFTSIGAFFKTILDDILVVFKGVSIVFGF